MPSPANRTQAKHRAMIAQGAAALLVLAGVAFGITGLETRTVQPSTEIFSVKGADLSTIATDENEADALTIDIGPLADRLALVENAPVEEIIEVPDPQGPRDPIQSTGGLEKRLRYIGFIKEGRRNAAFIRIDGVQRIVRESTTARAGEEGYEDLTISMIRPGYIVVSDGEIEERIMLGERTGQSISMVNGNEIDAISLPEESNERPNTAAQEVLDRRRERLEERSRSQDEGRGLQNRNLNGARRNRSQRND